MQGYCTVRDVRLALAPLSEWANPATAASLTDGQIEDAINEAEGLINLYVSARYQVPVIEVEQSNDAEPPVMVAVDVAPDPVRGFTRNIAAYLSALTFRKNKDLPEDDPIRLRYRLTLDALTMIRDSKADLPDDFDLPTGGDSGAAVFNLYEGTMFSMSDMGLTHVGSGRTSAQYFIPADLWRV